METRTVDPDLWINKMWTTMLLQLTWRWQAYPILWIRWFHPGWQNFCGLDQQEISVRVEDTTWHKFNCGFDQGKITRTKLRHPIFRKWTSTAILHTTRRPRSPQLSFVLPRSILHHQDRILLWVQMCHGAKWNQATGNPQMFEYMLQTPWQMVCRSVQKVDR